MNRASSLPSFNQISCIINQIVFVHRNNIILESLRIVPNDHNYDNDQDIKKSLHTSKLSQIDIGLPFFPSLIN